MMSSRGMGYEQGIIRIMIRGRASVYMISYRSTWLKKIEKQE